jgi:hypothetical protein
MLKSITQVSYPTIPYSTVPLLSVPYPQGDGYQRYPARQRQEAQQTPRGKGRQPKQNTGDNQQHAACSHKQQVLRLPPKLDGRNYADGANKDGPRADETRGDSPRLDEIYKARLDALIHIGDDRSILDEPNQ